MDRATFLEHLRGSGLLSEWEIEESVSQLPEGQRAGPVARALIARGLLTRYQARQLLAGKPRRLFLGPYKILEELGSGGMARVYKAAHRTMERIVAIKVLPARMLKDRMAYSLFLREVRAAARLQHPNIVMAYDHRKARGVHFLVMEYVDGLSLLQLVKDGGPLAIRLACDLMRQAAIALQHAHERKMVHRDIKPANLLIARPSSPSPEASAGANPKTVEVLPVLKVVDFGLARIRGEITHASDTIRGGTGSVLGTLDYISPEQANDIHDTDIRSDLYSLGCTFYFALTGQVPFPGGTGMTKVLKHLVEEPKPIEALRSDVPAGVAAIIRRLMVKDRTKRFQTPAELAAGLAPWCEFGQPQRRSIPTPDVVAQAPPSAEAGSAPGSAAFPGPMADATSEPAAPLAPPMPLSQLQQKWWQWTAVVEHILQLRRRAKISPETFKSLQQEILGAAQAGQRVANTERRAFFERLGALVEPWLDLRCLVELEHEIHCCLLSYCLDAGKEIDAWLRAERSEAGSSETVVTDVPDGFKSQKEWRAFRLRMRKFFGADL